MDIKAIIAQHAIGYAAGLATYALAHAGYYASQYAPQIALFAAHRMAGWSKFQQAVRADPERAKLLAKIVTDALNEAVTEAAAPKEAAPQPPQP